MALPAAAAACLVAAALAASAAGNMVPGRPPRLANPNPASRRPFSTEYTAEYFEVYSEPIRTRYSEVYWKMQGDIPLPEAIVRRFRNRTMAVVGYEVDQVYRTRDGDVPVPITWAYNHHYEAFLLSPQARMVRQRASAEAIRRGHNHGAPDFWTAVPRGSVPGTKAGIPISQYFSEGNGGEMRRSYHGYPRGFAQLVDAPATFHLRPMQVDTKNREHPGPDFRPGPLPRSALAPPDATYSGLLECPCSSRLSRELRQTYRTEAGGAPCQEAMDNASECFAAATAVVRAKRYSNSTGEDVALPAGCSVVAARAGVAEVFWNQAKSTAPCGAPAPAGRRHLVASARTVLNLTVDLAEQGVPGGEATITISGPADVWMGIGLGADSMCLHFEADACPGGGPYAIIIAGETVTERKLAFHGPGAVLEPSVQVRSNTVEGGVRTVVLARPLPGKTAQHFTFDLAAASVPFVGALGGSLTFAQHAHHASDDLHFVEAHARSCICRDGVQGWIGGDHFPHPSPCAAQPTGDLLKQKNPTCFPQTYGGGLRCCRHRHFLLDEDQEVPGEAQEYHLKFRFYFEEYSAVGVPSHKNLVRLYWQTEAFAGEYDIVRCLPGTPSKDCIQVITSRWRVADMMNTCDVREGNGCTGVDSRDPQRVQGVHLVYAGPHCHAPDCLSMELYNADTGRLLCSMVPEVGSSERVYDERGYVALPPCLWGEPEDGLVPPELLSLDTELLSIKRDNSTRGHYGEMASWQMRGVVVYKEDPADVAEARLARARGRSLASAQGVADDDDDDDLHV